MVGAHVRQPWASRALSSSLGPAHEPRAGDSGVSGRKRERQSENKSKKSGNIYGANKSRQVHCAQTRPYFASLSLISCNG